MTDWPRHIYNAEHGPECFGCKLATIQFESANEHAMEVRKRDRKFDQDAAAYRRLRADGLQPRGVDNSAMAEKLASHKSEVEVGHSLTKEEVGAFNRELGPIK